MAQHKHRKYIRTVIAVMILNTLEHQVQTEEPECQIQKSGGKMEAYCSELGLTSIPSELPTNIESLIMVKNPIKEITRKDLAKFNHLKVFKHDNDNAQRTIPLKIESNAFVDLIELKEFHLIQVNLSLNGFVILPMKVETITIMESFLHDKVFDFSTLENLKFIDLRYNSLTSVPNFHKYAPLEYIALNSNPIDIIPLSSIVRYCKLKTCYITFLVKTNYTTTAKDKCECRRWEEWYNRKKIRGYLIGGRLGCPSVEPCTEELIPKSYEQQWDDCVNNVRDAPPRPSPSPPGIPNMQPANVTPAMEEKPTSKILYLLVLLLALVVLLTAVCGYLIFRKKRPSVPIYDQEDIEPEQGEEEGLEIN